jgi:hypothetical protein
MGLLRKLAFTLTMAAVTVFASMAIGGHASAVAAGNWNAGRIMDDAIFFNPNTMGPSDIQAFLNSKVPTCDTNGSQPRGGTSRAAYGTSQGYPPPYTCLKDYAQAIPNKGPDAYCSGGIGGGTKSAALIIYEVGQACGVSPKALLVLLEKEQSLVTDDWPWSIQYRSATGYGCPDTAPCDAEYYGFFNQVYNAAHQFQRYAKQPGQFNYGGGRTSYVQYNPNAGCGGTNVGMQNQTTAGLYNYTPYQPNAAALNNLYGTGDGCSAYGNRNFWRMYNDWFGPTYTTVPFAWAFEGQWAYANSGRTQLFSNTPTVAPGGTIYMRIKARNMGNQTWNQSFMHLGGSGPMDRASQFYDSGSWLSNTRPAQMVESSVAPGSIGTFDFTMKAPATAGTYKEYFNLVAEGHTWLNDLGLFFTINVNTPASANNSNRSVLNSGQTLNKGDVMLSPDSQSSLSIQGDGNMALYSDFNIFWETGTQGSTASKLVMQTDGNLVLYNQSGVALWSSQTNGNAGARLVMQTDGNMVVYSASNVPLWASYTIHTPDHLSYVNTTLQPGVTSARLYPGQSIDTADRKYHLVLQGDGNLVLYSPTRALWATGTDGKQVAFLAQQLDGNLVLYDKSGRPLWYSGTSGHGTLRLVVQQDGNLVIYNPLNQPFWHTGTSGAQ